MTPEELRHAASVMLAAADGAEIQYWDKYDLTWIVDDTPNFNWGVTMYRVKPKTIQIGDMEVPEPVRKSLEAGTQYFIVDINDADLHDVGLWASDGHDEYSYLSRGLLHLTKEAAIAHAKALIKISGGNIDNDY